MALTAKWTGTISNVSVVVTLGMSPNILPVDERVCDVAEARQIRILNNEHFRYDVTSGASRADRAAHHLAIEHQRSCRPRNNGRTRLRRVKSCRENPEVAQRLRLGRVGAKIGDQRGTLVGR